MMGKSHNWIYIVLIFVSVILFVGYFYFQIYFSVPNSLKLDIKDGSIATSSYKIIAYIGFAREQQPFWTAMGKFSEMAASERKITYLDLTPETASVEEQIASLNLAIDQKVGGIIIGANSPQSLMTVLDRAYEAHIPVVAIDTAVKSPAIVSLIATDNLESARLAGDYIVKATNASGTVLILCGEKTHPNSIARETGVKEKAESAGMQVIVYYTDWQAEKAYLFASEELSKPNNITAIFSCTDPGILSAMRAAELNNRKDIILVGFDGLQEVFLEIANGGRISATVAQPIKQMAREGIETVLDYLDNKMVKSEKLIPGIIVTKENAGYFLD
jgi:ribose transport system substrate-binding protein